MRSALLLVLVAGSLACTDGTRAGTPSSSQAAAEPVFVPPSLPWAYDRGFAPEGHGPDRPMLRNAEVAAKFVAALERDAPIVFTVPTDVLCEVAEVIANAKLGPSSVELYGDIVGVDPTCLAKLDPIYLSHYVGPRPDYEAEQRAFFELTRAVPPAAWARFRRLWWSGAWRADAGERRSRAHRCAARSPSPRAVPGQPDPAHGTGPRSPARLALARVAR